MALTKAELLEQNELLNDTLDKVQTIVDDDDLDDDEKTEAISDELDEITEDDEEEVKAYPTGSVRCLY